MVLKYNFFPKNIRYTHIKFTHGAGGRGDNTYTVEEICRTVGF